MVKFCIYKHCWFYHDHKLLNIALRLEWSGWQMCLSYHARVTPLTLYCRISGCANAELVQDCPWHFPQLHSHRSPLFSPTDGYLQHGFVISFPSEIPQHGSDISFLVVPSGCPSGFWVCYFFLSPAEAVSEPSISEWLSPVGSPLTIFPMWMPVYLNFSPVELRYVPPDSPRMRMMVVA